MARPARPQYTFYLASSTASSSPCSSSGVGVTVVKASFADVAVSCASGFWTWLSPSPPTCVGPPPVRGTECHCAVRRRSLHTQGCMRWCKVFATLSPNISAKPTCLVCTWTTAGAESAPLDGDKCGCVEQPGKDAPRQSYVQPFTSTSTAVQGLLELAPKDVCTLSERKHMVLLVLQIIENRLNGDLSMFNRRRQLPTR